MLYSIGEVKQFATGLDHPEGVAVGRDGTVYAGGENGQVYRISADGSQVEIMANTGGFCLGITLDQQENLYICDCGGHAVYKLTREGRVSVFTDSCDGHGFTNPNFSVLDSQGNLYFTDSGDWKKANGAVFRARPDGTTSLFAGSGFHFANGIAMDAKEQYLYLVESNLDRVLRLEIKRDGSAGSAEVYADGLASVPDGLAFDSLGNLYVTTYGSNAIYRVSPDRRVELLCQDIESELLCLATNCAFGGPNFDQLLVANLGHHHLSALDLKVKGQPLVHQRGR